MFSTVLEKWNKRFAIGKPPSQGQTEGLQWLMLVRLAVLYSLLCVIVLEQVFKNSAESPWLLAYALLSAGFAFNLFNSLILSKLPGTFIVPVIHLVFDATLISFWIAYGGNLLVLMYLVQILAVSLTLFQRGALTAAFVSSIAYGVVTLGYKNGNASEWLIYSILFLVLGIVGGYLSEELLRTEQRLKEKSRALDKVTALHEKILNHMPTGLLTIDRNMRINYLNPAAESILGKLAREVTGKHLGEVEPGLLPFFTKVDYQELMGEEETEIAISSTGTDHHRSVFMEPRASKGHARLQQTVEMGRGSSLKILRGDVAELDPEAGVGRLLETTESGGRVLLFQDVTKLLNLEDKLKQNEKLAAVGQLAAGIAHEIRNPLAGVSGSIELLKRSPEIKDPESQKLMDIAIREIDRLNDLITEFLDFVKPEKMRFSIVSLAKILDEIIQSANSHPWKKIETQISKELSNDAIALASEEKLKQVVWNLVLNAFQAMKKVGRVSIGCKVLSEQRVCFWVEDEGEGMTEDVLQHLYEPFFTTKDRGTGLGLATSYKIVEAHHGEIRVESKVGKGTKFEVILPRA